jgi:hypothetical protein
MLALRQNIDNFLEQAKTALGYCLQTPEISNAMAAVGYDNGALQEGFYLLQQAERLHVAFVQEHDLSSATTTALLQYALEQADSRFTVHRNLAQIALSKSPEQRQAVQLDVRQKRSLFGWLEQARQFYTNALRDPDILQALSGFGVTREKLLEGQTLVQRIVTLNWDNHWATPEIRQASVARDAALDDLDAWLAAFWEAAQISLAEQPKHLEAIRQTLEN